MDCFGRRSEPADDKLAGTQHFMTADFNRAIHIHHTSLDLDDDSRIFGRSQGKLMMVADGLGPGERGQRASTVAIDAVSQYLLNAFRIADQASVGDQLFESKLKEALEYCQTTIRREGGVIEAHRGMGTEISVAYVCWPNLYVVQAGRTYCSLWRDGTLAVMSNSAATEVVGGQTDHLSPAFVQHELRLGDKLILGSHSLQRALGEFEITSIASQRTTAAEMCRAIVDAASAKQPGEHTAVVATFDEGVAVAPESNVQRVSTSAEQSQPPTPIQPTNRGRSEKSRSMS